jgi:membrane fusion protein, multidrug efflux system
MLTAEGTLTNARIDLGYTEIIAPIAGLIDRTSLTKGNLVGPASGVLTTIAFQDPIYVVSMWSSRTAIASCCT